MSTELLNELWAKEEAQWIWDTTRPVKKDYVPYTGKPHLYPIGTPVWYFYPHGKDYRLIKVTRGTIEQHIAGGTYMVRHAHNGSLSVGISEEGLRVVAVFRMHYGTLRPKPVDLLIEAERFNASMTRPRNIGGSHEA